MGKRQSCTVCNYTTPDAEFKPLGVNDVFECSHVDCPHRTSARVWSGTPNHPPATFKTGAQVEREKQAMDRAARPGGEG